MSLEHEKVRKKKSLTMLSSNRLASCISWLAVSIIFLAWPSGTLLLCYRHCQAEVGLPTYNHVTSLINVQLVIVQHKRIRCSFDMPSWTLALRNFTRQAFSSRPMLCQGIITLNLNHHPYRAVSFRRRPAPHPRRHHPCPDLRLRLRLPHPRHPHQPSPGAPCRHH